MVRKGEHWCEGTQAGPSRGGVPPWGSSDCLSLPGMEAAARIS